MYTRASASDWGKDIYHLLDYRLHVSQMTSRLKVGHAKVDASTFSAVSTAHILPFQTSFHS